MGLFDFERPTGGGILSVDGDWLPLSTGKHQIHYSLLVVGPRMRPTGSASHFLANINS